MSDSDSFIREVTEEVRQDRMLRLWKRYGPYVIGAIAALVVAAAVLQWMDARERQAALERGAAFLEGDVEDVTLATRLVEETEGPAAVLARMRLGAALAAAGDAAAAAETYEAVARLPGIDPAYGDLAEMKAIRLAAGEAGTLAPAEAAGRLEALVREGRPYRLLALELRAALRAEAGDLEGAEADLATLFAEPGLPEGLQGRAGALAVSLGLDLDALAGGGDGSGGAGSGAAASGDG